MKKSERIKQILAARYRDDLRDIKCQIIEQFGDDRKNPERAELLSWQNSRMERTRYDNPAAERRANQRQEKRMTLCNHIWKMVSHEERHCPACDSYEFIPDPAGRLGAGR